MHVLIIDNINGRISKITSYLSKHNIDYTSISFDKLYRIEANIFDALILTGTSKSTKDDIDLYKGEIEIIKKASIPIIGICGGCQLLNLAYGGDIVEIKKPIYGKKKVDVISDDPVFDNIQSNMFFSKHKYVMKSINSNFKVIAKYNNYIYVIKHKENDIYGCQFHPERGGDGEMFLNNFFKNIQYKANSKEKQSDNIAANRLNNLTENYFSNLTTFKENVNEGDYIDLSEGNPDVCPDKKILDMMSLITKDPNIYKYPTRWGAIKLRKRILKYFSSKGYKISSYDDVLPVLGTKEAITHISLSFLNKNDVVLVPDIAYPFYKLSALYCEATIVEVDTDENYIPVIENIPEEILLKAKVFWINYPNNPTGSIISQEQLEKIVLICNRYKIILAYDLAYSDIVYSKYNLPLSIYTLKSKPDTGFLEIYSLSKSFSLPGCRLGFILGNRELLKVIEKSKSVFDTGIYIGFQKLMSYIYQDPDKFTKPIKCEYEKRINFFCNNLHDLGFNTKKPEGTFYCWIQVPNNMTSKDFLNLLFSECKIIALPGEMFGDKYNNYVRFSLTQPIDILKIAVNRIKSLSIK